MTYVNVPWRDQGRTPAERAETLLAELTLEEKVAQLGSVWIRVDDGGEVAPMQDFFAVPGTDLDDRLRDGIGHLTRVHGTEPLSPAEGAERLRLLQERVVAASRLGIPAIAHEECLTGFAAFGATAYPTPLAWAATFDPALVERMAAAIGRDLRAAGVHQGLSPVLDVVRDYRWGRVEETLGEDPYLVGQLGAAYVRGLEQTGIIATLKHFAGYAASRAARNHAPVGMGPREFADVILPPFETALREGGARSVMNSYTDVDGVPVAASADLLRRLLREEWGFDGTVVSDYWSIPFLATMHRVAEDDAAAGALALRAGIDVELPETRSYGRNLVEQVKAGRVEESVVDEAVRRVLRQKAELGLLDGGPLVPEGAADADPDSAANRELAAAVAERSIVLLRNAGRLLPLDPRTTARIAVIGPCADDPRTLMGCYSFPNHVLDRYPSRGMGLPVETVLSRVEAEFPGAAVRYALGADVSGGDTSGFAAAADLAAGSDVALLLVGDRAGMFGGGTSGEGCDAADLRLPGVQAELVEAVLETGTPVVLVVVSGRPYALGAYEDRVAAAIQAFFPGVEGGAALAGVLSGRVNPSGRLPVQIPRSPSINPSTYLQPPLGGRADGITVLDPTPAFPFGHGLSYAPVAYEAMGTSQPECRTDGEIEARVTVRNAGERPVEEVVQLYASDPVAQVTRPVVWLVGFARVPLEPGESREVAFDVPADAFSFTGVDGRRLVEPGEIVLSSGPSAGDLPLSARIRVTGAPGVLGAARRLTTRARLQERNQ
ncbi:glycoside hydrolase family 3 C-terminal domain-containing protein [Nonomuraea sp. 3-1Str]|uniref:beta-glucosidase family protein n=1 Tax=Nonomuraea sp. 3-1Str TaxID=2929801 RepID=UPI0028602F92|nr:glycoside hydrolase family 3 N-terminal domain-containing protein [Nonomuraea sp. 3-1Str]MDR8413051.1 glycoside hydrolase family 3 C-terminal domain-containing protein [Nonomuraea sp. 3-1Str]